MNRLIDLTGGQPLVLDDLTWIEDNVLAVADALASTVGDSPFKLYGAEISVADSGGANPLLSITKGAIYKDGEIYQIDAVVSQVLNPGTTLLDITSSWEWDSIATYSGSRVYADGFTKLPLESIKATLLETPVNWVGIEANLISAIDIRRSEGNLDILNTGYQNPSTFTTLYDDSASSIYKSYALSYGEHILRLYTPSGGNAIMTSITPPANVYDGYELTIEVKANIDPQANRGLGFYRGTADGNVTSNLNIATINIITSTVGVLSQYTKWDHFVSFNPAHSSIYDSAGIYDPLTAATGTFKMLFRWNVRTSQWDEVSRTKHQS